MVIPTDRFEWPIISAVTNRSFQKAEPRNIQRNPNAHEQSDNLLNELDRVCWIDDLKKSYFGDANLDGDFNSSDLVVVFTSGKYETGATASWPEGDWNGDMLFESGDIVTAFTAGGNGLGPRKAIAAVPEPSGLILFTFFYARSKSQAGFSNSTN